MILSLEVRIRRIESWDLRCGQAQQGRIGQLHQGMLMMMTMVLLLSPTPNPDFSKPWNLRSESCKDCEVEKEM